MIPVSCMNAPHYIWGNSCDGWILSPDEQLLIIEERMPPGTAEVRHHYTNARQFFYALEGELTLEIDGALCILRVGEGCAILPGVKHQARNDSATDTRFLVLSSPSTRGDRIDEY